MAMGGWPISFARRRRASRWGRRISTDSACTVGRGVLSIGKLPPHARRRCSDIDGFLLFGDGFAKSYSISSLWPLHCKRSISLPLAQIFSGGVHEFCVLCGEICRPVIFLRGFLVGSVSSLLERTRVGRTIDRVEASR